MKKILAFSFLILFSFVSCTPSHDTMKKLKASWECEYLKINISDKWKQTEGTVGSSCWVDWSWSDDLGDNYIRFSISSLDFYKGMDRDEAEKYYNSHKSPEDMHIESKFVSNGQAYLLIAKPVDGIEKKIIFYADKIRGEFTFTYYDESIVKLMIDTMTFYKK